MRQGRRSRNGVWRSAGLVVGFAGVVALLGLDLGRGDTLAIVALAIVVIGYAVGSMIISRQLADLPVLDVVAASSLCAVGYAPAGLAPSLPSCLRVVSGAGATGRQGLGSG